MQGFSSNEDEDTDKISNERNTDDSGSFARGAANVLCDGDGEGEDGKSG